MRQDRPFENGETVYDKAGNAYIVEAGRAIHNNPQALVRQSYALSPRFSRINPKKGIDNGHGFELYL